MVRILLVEPLDAATETRLETQAEVIRPAERSEPGLCAVVGDCDAIIARTHTPITRTLIEKAPRLKVVGVAGVGIDRVDEMALRERNIALLYTPAASSDAVAEFAIGLLLQLLRPVPRFQREYAAGSFAAARANPHGAELRDLCVGVIGMGRIGSRVGRICAAGFGARVIYHDIADVGPFAFSATRVSREELLAESDVITLHTPLTPATRGMIDQSTLSRVKPSSLLINTARGALVDTLALTQALRDGRLAGAGLDVTDPEPLPPEHPLFTLPNCVLTPHVAARTPGGVRRMFNVVDDVLACLAKTT